MNTALDQIAGELPDGPFWITGKWMKRFIGALVRDRVRAGDNLEEIPTNKGRQFNAPAGGGAAVAQTYVWQPYRAPFTGTGTPPADQGLKIMIRPGEVTDGFAMRLPARRNIVIDVPANCTDGYYVYLKADVGSNARITALDYNYGSTLPDDATITDSPSGAPPPVAYALLFIVTSTETQVEFANVQQIRKTNLTLAPSFSGYDATTSEVQLRMLFSA